MTMADSSTMDRRQVLTFGEALVAMVPDSAGSVSSMQQFRPYPAGAELNTAVGLARLGLQPAFAGCVGDDVFGLFLQSSARAEGVDVTFLQRTPETPTAVLFKQWLGLRHSTSVFYYRSTSPMATGKWQADTLQAELVRGRWDWLHSTGITWMIGQGSAQTATNLLKQAHHQGIPVSFDVNIRLKLASISSWKQLISELVPYITWFFVGDEEARQLFATDAATDVEQRLRSLGFCGAGVVVKRGEQGATASMGGLETSVPVWPVRHVVDTVGAGDGFNAGFIAGMLRGGDIQAALRLASLVGAFAVTSVGDYQGYPTWAEALLELNGSESVER